MVFTSNRAMHSVADRGCAVMPGNEARHIDRIAQIIGGQRTARRALQRLILLD
jgi:hypothetical protein